MATRHDALAKSVKLSWRVPLEIAAFGAAWVLAHRGNGASPMTIASVIPQLRTTDLPVSIRFYTETRGLVLAFRYEDFYAGVRAGDSVVHLKRVDEADPSIAFVDRGVAFVKDVPDTPWGTTGFAIKDDQGHTLDVGQRRPGAAGA